MNVPLFPLSTTLFPQGVLPLKIFEPRYLAMVQTALRDKSPFGVVSLLQGSEIQAERQELVFSQIGVLAYIESFEEIKPNLYFLICKGVERFKVLSKDCDESGLWRAQVELLADDVSKPIPKELESAANKLGQVILSFQKHHIKASEMPFTQPYRLDDCGWVANRWSEMLPLSSAQKELLLGQSNPRLRLDLVNDFLEDMQISIQFPSG